MSFFGIVDKVTEWLAPPPLTLGQLLTDDQRRQRDDLAKMAGNPAAECRIQATDKIAENAELRKTLSLSKAAHLADLNRLSDANLRLLFLIWRIRDLEHNIGAQSATLAEVRDALHASNADNRLLRHRMRRHGREMHGLKVSLGIARSAIKDGTARWRREVALSETTARALDDERRRNAVLETELENVRAELAAQQSRTRHIVDL